MNLINPINIGIVVVILVATIIVYFALVHGSKGDIKVVKKGSPDDRQRR